VIVGVNAVLHGRFHLGAESGIRKGGGKLDRPSDPFKLEAAGHGSKERIH
jgi:hypothetical protein